MAVIVEYKNQKLIRIVESAKERREREYYTAKRIQKARIRRLYSTQFHSPNTSQMRKDNWYCSEYSDTKCWKNQKHAKKGWMRHLHRLNPSVRSIADNCIYPHVYC